MDFFCANFNKFNFTYRQSPISFKAIACVCGRAYLAVCILCTMTDSLSWQRFFSLQHEENRIFCKKTCWWDTIPPRLLWWGVIREDMFAFFFFVLYDGIMSIIEIKYIHHAFAPDSGFYHFLKVQHDLRFRIEVNLVPEVIEIVLVAQHVL